MKVVAIKDSRHWNKFVVTNSTPAAFPQSWEWGEFQKTQRQKILRVAVFPEGASLPRLTEAIAVASLIKWHLPLMGLGFWYLPRGPVIAQQHLGSQQAVVTALLAWLQERRNGAIFTRLIPPWSKASNKLDWESSGWQSPEILARRRDPELTLLTNIELSEEQLLQNMHRKTRYNTRLAKKRGVSCRLCQSPAELRAFWDLLSATAKREKIKLYPPDYYQNLVGCTGFVTGPNVKVSQERLISLVALSEYQGRALAAGLWLGFGNTLTYLYGGSLREHKNVMAPHRLHWEVMKWGREQGYKYYDWWGIDYPGSPFHLKGVTRFKLGFGGEQLAFAGTYDYIQNQRLFKHLLLLKRLKRIF